MSTGSCRMTGRCMQSHSRRALAGLEAWMAVSRFYDGLWCGGSSHSSLVGARPSYTRDGCIAQRLELRVGHGRPPSRTSENRNCALDARREFEGNDVPGNTGGSDTRPSAADVQVWTHGEVTGEANWVREQGESRIMDLWVMPNKGQGFTRLR